MSERAIRLFVPGFLLVYFVFGFGRWITYQVEIYPIGAWGMFHRIDKVFNDYELLVHRKGERHFDPPAGIALTGQARLVMNGFVRLTERGDLEDAARYRDFVEREVVGPDAEYEMVLVLDRSRPKEYHLIRRRSFGPYTTPPDQLPPVGARFEFPDGNKKYQKKKDKDRRRVKRKKSPR